MTNTATVTSHEILARSTAIFSWSDGRFDNRARLSAVRLTPELALRQLGELSTNVRAAVLLDAHGDLAAAEPEDGELANDLRELLLDLFESADAADDEPVAEVEVTGPTGAVFVARGGDFTLAVVTDRLALSSLIRHDLRRVLADLDRGAGKG